MLLAKDHVAFRAVQRLPCPDPPLQRAYLRKGSQAYIEGQIESRSWEKDGQKHYATEVVLRPFNSELLLLDKAERPAAQPAQRRERGAEPSGRR
jgi:single-strand DNA-binding protein